MVQRVVVGQRVFSLCVVNLANIVTADIVTRDLCSELIRNPGTIGGLQKSRCSVAPLGQVPSLVCAIARYSQR